MTIRAKIVYYCSIVKFWDKFNKKVNTNINALKKRSTFSDPDRERRPQAGSRHREGRAEGSFGTGRPRKDTVSRHAWSALSDQEEVCRLTDK